MGKSRMLRVAELIQSELANLVIARCERSSCATRCDYTGGSVR